MRTDKVLHSIEKALHAFTAAGHVYLISFQQIRLSSISADQIASSRALMNFHSRLAEVMLMCSSGEWNDQQSGPSEMASSSSNESMNMPISMPA